MKKLLNLFLVFVVAVNFIACSDLKKEEVQKPALSDSRFEFNCKLDVSALKNILKEPVEEQVNCLESYLLLIANILASDKSRAIGRNEFKNLLKVGIDGVLEDVDEDLIRALDAVFELNFLIGSGDKNFITEAELKNLMEILRNFNREVIPVYHEFTKIREVEYSWHKERRREIFQSATRLVQPILASFSKNRDTIDKSDLFGILDVFSTGDEDDIIDKVKDFLIVKKIVLGGKTNVITHKELFNLFKKAPAIISVAYDALQFSDINFKNTLEIFDFANTALTNIGRDIIVKRRAGNPEIFTIRELEYYFKKIYTGTMKIDFFKAKKVIQLVKDIFFGEGKAFTGIQLRRFTSTLRKLGKRMEYFLALYQANQEELDQKRTPFRPSLRNLKPRNQEEVDFTEEFKQMVGRYRYFKGDKTSVTLAKKTRRNSQSILEYAVLETLGKEIFDYWERKHPCDGNDFNKDDKCKKENLKGDLTIPQVQLLLAQLEGFLVDAGFIKEGSLSTVANSAVLLSDLLLNTSNSDVGINPHETAELVTVVLSAVNVGEIVYERLRLVCATNDKTELEPECVKNNFVKELFLQGEEVEISSYMPLFSNYAKSAPAKDLRFMVEGALGYSQTCSHFRNGEAVFISKGDISLMLMGMMHIESVIVLYDDNNNNQLDTSEIKRLYDERFYSLIDEVVGVGFFNKLIVGKKLRYKIFLEIIRNYKEPGLVRVLGMKFENKSSLYRVGQRPGLNEVLKEIGGTGNVDPDKCEKLR